MLVSHSFIILAYDRTVITIVNYECKTFIVQATDLASRCFSMDELYLAGLNVVLFFNSRRG